MIPHECVLLVAGVPASGKSSFGRYLAAEEGFVHYDLEADLSAWPLPGLKPLWDSDRSEFAKRVRELHGRVVLDWGFPPACLPMVQELRAAGARLIWFTGDGGAARAAFIQRSGLPAVASFDRQMEAITAAGFPDELRCEVVIGVDRGGHVAPRLIADQLFRR